ncbi:MAG: rod shape-determining protein MreC [Desulfobulbaceae bacterium]|nr:rod shape-determining protein MreC [Desulfobulbaceae bacterium]HIJ77687.1 rod shape-determining protein MreC [Deltaproteobacteria bacterium]
MRKRSNRAKQLKVFFLFGLLLTLILILIVSTVGRQEFNAPHKLAFEVIGTAQKNITTISNYFTGIWANYTSLINVREENKRLRDELQKFKATNNEYREAVATNVRLAKLLQMKESLPSPTLTAQIIGKDPSEWFKTIIIDRGSSDGVQKGMPAVTVEGVVGQVVNTSPHYAKILLATDPNSAIEALIQKTRVQGIIKGTGTAYDVNYVLKNCDVQEGDHIVTSGLGGIFPKGLPIGVVSNVTKTRRGMFQKIAVAPSTDFSQLEYLIIIMKKDSLAK